MAVTPDRAGTDRQLRILHAAFLASSVLFAVLGEALAGERQPVNELFPMLFYLLGFMNIAIAFVMRRWMVEGTEEKLAKSPADPESLMRYRAGHIAGFALCESAVLLGFVLRFLGGTLPQVLPLYIAGALVLALFMRPKSAI